VTPLYPQKLALTTPTGGGRSVGIVRSRTKATEFSLVLDILSEENCQFLQYYRRLFQLPELFKTKEAFSEMRNKQARKGAKKKSQGFEIENVTICCGDVSLLRVPIPYARRLLQLFPRIKQNTNCVLSPHEIRNNAHQIAIRHYQKRFSKAHLIVSLMH
jgi:hypothetical protein